LSPDSRRKDMMNRMLPVLGLLSILTAPVGFAATLTERVSPTEGPWVVGELRPFAFASQSHSASVAALHRLGWLECRGEPLAKKDFGDLFAALGETWGSGPHGTFRAPDLRGRASQRRFSETYRQLMGGDLVQGREDKTGPTEGDVSVYIYVGRDVSGLDPKTGRVALP
jgi:hypothetical protein